jgi:hypothetical protein
MSSFTGTTALLIPMVQEVPVKLISSNEINKSVPYQALSQKESIHPQLSIKIFTELPPLKKQKRVPETLENIDSLSEDSEEDGDWNNAITVDRETANNKEKLFTLLHALSRRESNILNLS